MPNFAWIKKSGTTQGKKASSPREIFDRFPISVSTAWCWHMALGWPLSARYKRPVSIFKYGSILYGSVTSFFVLLELVRNLLTPTVHCEAEIRVFQHQGVNIDSFQEMLDINRMTRMIYTTITYSSELWNYQDCLFVCLKTKTKEFVWHGQLRYKCFSFQT